MWSKGEWVYDLLKERYGEEIGVWLGEHFAELLEPHKDDNADNFRVAEVDKPKEMVAYRWGANRGCCGYIDRVFVHPSGRKFTIGFNFGH